MLRKVCILLFIAASVLILPSCASDNSQAKADDNSNESTIPWNRQEKWDNGSNVPGADMIGTQ